MKNKRKMKKIKWIKILSRAITPQIITILLSPATTFFEKLGTGFKNHLYAPENGKHNFYFDSKEFPEFINNIMKNAEKEGYIEKQIETCIKDSKVLIKSSKACSKNAKGKSNKELAKAYLEYLKKFEGFYAHMWIAHPLEEYLEKAVKLELEKELNKKKKGNLFNEYFKVITTKIKLIEAEKEQIGLFEIASKIEENGGKISKGINKLIEKHVKKYCWLPFYGLDLKLWDTQHFLNTLKEIKNPKQELKKLKNELNGKTDSLNKVKEDFKNNKKLIKLIDLLQEYLFFRTERADMMRRAYYYARPFFIKVAKRMNWNYDDVVYTTPEELVDFLKNKRSPNLDEVKERQKQFLIISKNGDTRLISKKKEIESIIKKEIGEEALKITILEGDAAFPGTVEGRVKIIKSIKEIDRLEKGDILVTSMTTPDMTIDMSKVIAIITDEGGITSHAAIVSKELKIPCIIRTGNATKVLKDGNLVRVDATKGIVEKIEE